MTKRFRRRALLAVVPAVAMLTTASMAYACVVVWGEMQVLDGNGGVSEARGTGLHPAESPTMNTNAEYCSPPLGGATVSSNAVITVRVTHQPACEPTGGQALDDGTYAVRLETGQVFTPLAGGGYFRTGGAHPTGQCWFGNFDHSVKPLGTLQVDNAGNGEGTYTVPSNLNQATNGAGVCVAEQLDADGTLGHTPAQSGAPHVNMVPIDIVVL